MDADEPAPPATDWWADPNATVVPGRTATAANTRRLTFTIAAPIDRYRSHPWPRFHLFNLSRRTLTAAALTLFPLLALVTCSHPAG